MMVDVGERVEVSCRHGTYPGVRVGRVCAYEFEIPDKYEVRGHDRTQRVFVMLDEHIQLNQPLTFPEAFEDWWYVDLVEVVEVGDTISVADHWLDVAVPPAGHPYRVMDGELADALVAGQVSTEQVAAGLRRFQHFLGPIPPRTPRRARIRVSPICVARLSSGRSRPRDLGSDLTDPPKPQWPGSRMAWARLAALSR